MSALRLKQTRKTRIVCIKVTAAMNATNEPVTSLCALRSRRPGLHSERVGLLGDGEKSLTLEQRRPIELSSLRLLLIEDSEDDARLIVWSLTRGGFQIEHVCVETEYQLRDALEQPWDLIIADYTLPRFSGIEALAILRELELATPVILVSGKIGEEVAVTSLQAGAYDYVLKHNLTHLPSAVERALREAGVRRERDAAVTRLRQSEERLRTLVSNLPCVVFQLQWNPSENYRFQYVSDGSTLQLGLTPEALCRRAQSFLDLLTPEGTKEFHLALRNSGHDLAPAMCEISLRPAGGSLTAWTSVRFSPRVLADGGLMWEGTMDDITLRKRAEFEIAASRKQLAELTSHLEQAKESERTRIAREIHDDIGGNLTAIKIDLAWVSRHAKTPAIAAKVRELLALVDQTMDTTARIGRDLRPGILDLGLAAAIEWQGEEFARRLGVICNVACDGNVPAANPQLEAALFSIFRETLTNISKHAAARRVDVALRYAGGRLELTVADDGRGVADADMRKPGSFGLVGMRERVDQLGGVLQVSARPSGGTLIQVRLPLNNVESAPGFAQEQAA